MQIEIHGHQFQLLPQKAVWWKDTDTLLTGDLHLGKVTHFRKAGIAIPSTIPAGNFKRLDEILAVTQAKRIIFLGDLFHNRYNAEWDRFEEWRKVNSDVSMIIVPGNHDILPVSLFHNNDIALMETMQEGNFIFTHHPQESWLPDTFTFCGHIHPVFCLRDPAKQHIKLPCYVLESNQMVLPSFGLFTGGYEMARMHGRHIFVIAGDKVFAV